MNKEGSLPFWGNLSYNRLKFDMKADLVEQIIPLEANYVLLVDRIKDYHVISYDKHPENPMQYPAPAYSDRSSPNTIYSVDYLSLYKHLYKKKISQRCMEDYIFHIDQKNSKYIFYVYLGNHRLAIQMNRFDPVAIIDLHNVAEPSVVLEGVNQTKALVRVSNDCIAWVDKQKNVYLYSCSLKKRKILNFSRLKIRKLEKLNDDILIAKSKDNIEILNISTNTIIKSINFLKQYTTITLSVHPSSNTISYIYEGHIYIIKSEKGKIKWQNSYDFKEYQDSCREYTFIGDGYVAAEVNGNIAIFSLTPHNFSLITVIQSSSMHSESSGLNVFCCERVVKKGFILKLEYIDELKFAIVECFCKGQHLLHGLQKITVLTCNFKENTQKKTISSSSSLNGIAHPSFEISSNLLLEEYRDPVAIVDALDEHMAAFITERGRIFKVNLKTFTLTYITEISGLAVQKGYEMKFVDKFYIFSGNIVLIAIRTGQSSYIQIILFSLDEKSVKWDTNRLRPEGYDSEQTEEYSFYDTIKLNRDTILMSYNIRVNQVTIYQVGELNLKRENYSFHPIVVTEKEDEQIYDKLWLQKSALIAMRHGKNAFHLSLLDYNSQQIIGTFEVDKYCHVISSHIWGIIDVKSLTEEVIVVHVKMNTHNYIMSVYNWKTQVLLNQFKTDNCLISVFKDTPLRAKFRAPMQNTALFGFYALIEHGILVKLVTDLMDESKAEDLETEDPELGICIWPKNFSCVPRESPLAVSYEGDHNKNYICIIKPVNFRMECLKLIKTQTRDLYHNYVIKDILDMIFSL